MATWHKKYTYLDQYEFTSLNQHGRRYKQNNTERLSVAQISCETNDTDGMKNLILLSHHIDTPVRYDFSSKPQMAYIEVVSREALDKAAQVK